MQERKERKKKRSIFKRDFLAWFIDAAAVVVVAVVIVVGLSNLILSWAEKTHISFLNNLESDLYSSNLSMFSFGQTFHSIAFGNFFLE